MTTHSLVPVRPAPAPVKTDRATTSACPLCGATLERLLAAELRYGTGRVLLCEDCELGVLAAEATETPGYADGTYRERHGPRPDQPTTCDELFDVMVDFQEERLARLQPYLGGDVRLLEVGCASGYFLANVAGRVGAAIGLELDPEAAACAERRTGCRILTGDLAGVALPEASFDVVCAFQTLEHVADPVGFLKHLRRLVRPDGVVAVEVPNLSDPLLAVYDVPAWQRFYFHLAHRWYFSSTALTRATRQAGLLGRVTFVQDYNFLNHLHWHFSGSPQDSCRPGLLPVHWPTRRTAPPELRRALDGWAQRADREYKALLALYGATDNLWFLGTAAQTPASLPPPPPATARIPAPIQAPAATTGAGVEDSGNGGRA